MKATLKKRKVTIAFMTVFIIALFAVPAFAQTTTLDLDATMVQENLFMGANIIIGALASIVFLLAGFTFGGRILRSIGDWVTGFRF